MGIYCRCPLSAFLKEVFQACPENRTWEETPGKTQDMLQRLCLLADLETPRNYPGRAGGSGQTGEESGHYCLDGCPCDPTLDKQKKMDKWIKGGISMERTGLEKDDCVSMLEMALMSLHGALHALLIMSLFNQEIPLECQSRAVFQPQFASIMPFFHKKILLDSSLILENFMYFLTAPQCSTIRVKR